MRNQGFYYSTKDPAEWAEFLPRVVVKYKHAMLINFQMHILLLNKILWESISPNHQLHSKSNQSNSTSGGKISTTCTLRKAVYRTDKTQNKNAQFIMFTLNNPSIQYINKADFMASTFIMLWWWLYYVFVFNLRTTFLKFILFQWNLKKYII